MIEICNLRNKKPSNPWDFSIHRGSPVGNPYWTEKESERDFVCDHYEKFFHHPKRSKVFHAYLLELVEAHKKYGKLRLFCWCAPKRCHGETIKTYLEEQQEEL